MSKKQRGTPLAGSERAFPADAAGAVAAHPDERLEVSVLLRRRDAQGFAARMEQVRAGQAPEHLEREQFESLYGAAPEDIAAVTAFAQDHGLVVMSADAARRTVRLSGTVSQFNQAFGVELHHLQHAGGTYRCRSGAIYLPPELSGIVESVLGLDNRPQARAHFRVAQQVAAVAETPGSFTPTQLATLYQFPQGGGQGQCIALIELGGGYETADLSSYFSELNVTAPQVLSVGVDSAANQPGGDPSGADDDQNADNDEIGIVVCGLGIDGNGYVLEDLTCKAGPATWGRVSTQAYERHAADRIVGIGYRAADDDNLAIGLRQRCRDHR